MFTYNNIETLDIEITTACNAACPWCARELSHFNYDKKNTHEITLQQFKDWFDHDLLNHVKKLQFCGNFGDPAAGKDFFEIIQYAKEVNPDIVIGFNTNGGLRSVQWWRELATLLTDQRDYVVFSIDGLEDTNHLYRKNVSWKKVMANSKAFINAGGNAHWDMLIFDHNEHQIDQCKRLALEMGFKIFRKKVSDRPSTFFYNLQPINFYSKEINIDCMAQNQKSIFVSATGHCLPCCIIGNNAFRNLDNFVASHPDILVKNDVDLRRTPIRDIIPKLNDVVKTWHTQTPVDCCYEVCNHAMNKAEATVKDEIKLD